MGTRSKIKSTLSHLLEPQGNLGLSGSSSGDHETLLDERPDDALSVVDGSVSLGEHQLVGATEEDGHGLSGVLHSCHLDDLVSRSRDGDLSDVLGASELVGGHGVDVSDGLAA